MGEYRLKYSSMSNLSEFFLWFHPLKQRFHLTFKESTHSPTKSPWGKREDIGAWEARLICPFSVPYKSTLHCNRKSSPPPPPPPPYTILSHPTSSFSSDPITIPICISFLDSYPIACCSIFLFRRAPRPLVSLPDQVRAPRSPLFASSCAASETYPS
jgi:hypothetical protein